MPYPTPLESINRPLDPFLVSLCVEGGVAQVNVTGDVNEVSVPLLLEEIRHAAGMIKKMTIPGADEAESIRRLELDLTEVHRLETPAVNELTVLVHELE